MENLSDKIEEAASRFYHAREEMQGAVYRSNVARHNLYLTMKAEGRTMDEVFKVIKQIEHKTTPAALRKRAAKKGGK